jgi:GNAT superfamily N-acetyltransferase
VVSKQKRKQKRIGRRFVARLRIRRARLIDLEDLVRHRREMWTEIGIRNKRALDRADPEYRGWLRNGLRKGTLFGWIVQDEQKNLAGSGCLWLRPSQPRPGRRTASQPYLLSMYTEPRFRGKGVASMIVDEAKRWSKKKGFPELALHASKMGRRVYSRRGFKRSWEMRAKLGRLR